MFDSLKEELRAAKNKDPAARSNFEILCCYPGVWAIILHRWNHWLWTHNLPFWGRFFSQISRFLTGIEIHPGAQIGKRVFIDHGMGIVIGETTIVGDDVLIYQGVVLGGTSLSKGKRHPTVEDAVVIGSGAKVLGNITLGNSSKIGAGAVVLNDVPPGATAVGVPSRVIYEEQKTVEDLNHDFSDPVASAIDLLLERQVELEKQINILNQKLDIEKTGIIRDSEIEEVFKEVDE
ncbi:serine O-acetyltransferase EpsC [Methanobrevibacter olleyae]|uniref:Serine acetyltransferase n=1 Tax=Methanobrevibacter olleyae TaxID=294671 RepID=A0A126R0P3_METOL|nr:serine O-acetyltransferase EpsC [Methanobrevibacter olleyae]AMK15616.1 serine O-acetyltransferase CysE [Methanobrevibacter olleyae]SFL24740.1 serine O-acetyltransferase [Methanobrevibacter olleyae]